jgi:hypothetical protein
MLPESLAGCYRNPGRILPESLAECYWNLWPNKAGIINIGFLGKIRGIIGHSLVEFPYGMITNIRGGIKEKGNRRKGRRFRQGPGSALPYGGYVPGRGILAFFIRIPGRDLGTKKYIWNTEEKTKKSVFAYLFLQIIDIQVFYLYYRYFIGRTDKCQL